MDLHFRLRPSFTRLRRGRQGYGGHGGVPAKDANGETANSWEYCRQWIDRLHPRPALRLGAGAGAIEGQEDRQRQQVEQRSITDMEMRHAVLNTKLKRRSYFYLRATDAPAAASEYVDPPPLLRKLEQLNPKTEIRTADFADFADAKQVSLVARASDSSGMFRLQVFVYPCHPVIRGLNFGIRVEERSPLLWPASAGSSVRVDGQRFRWHGVTEAG